jgi:nucleoside-diphosphate-sugar epimerase
MRLWRGTQFGFAHITNPLCLPGSQRYFTFMSVLIFGLGYTSSAFVRRIGDRFGPVIGTHRQDMGQGGLIFNGRSITPELVTAVRQARIILVSTPPNETGDPVLACLAEEIAEARPHKQILYLSTIGVYGDQAGAWIDSKAALRTRSDRGQWRILAEQQWLGFAARTGHAVQVFRLGGIYGPGRNPLIDLAIGSSRRIEKKDQVFNRINVDDIALVLEMALAQGHSGAVWNVVDDEPAPPQDVIAYAAALCGAPLPPLIAFEAADMSPMARSFYADNRRVSNRDLKRGLGIKLNHPTYREGITALFQSNEYHAENTSLRPRDRKMNIVQKIIG